MPPPPKNLKFCNSLLTLPAALLRGNEFLSSTKSNEPANSAKPNEPANSAKPIIDSPGKDKETTQRAMDLSKTPGYTRPEIVKDVQ